MFSFVKLYNNLVRDNKKDILPPYKTVDIVKTDEIKLKRRRALTSSLVFCFFPHGGVYLRSAVIMHDTCSVWIIAIIIVYSHQWQALWTLTRWQAQTKVGRIIIISIFNALWRCIYALMDNLTTKIFPRYAHFFLKVCSLFTASCKNASHFSWHFD